MNRRLLRPAMVLVVVGLPVAFIGMLASVGEGLGGHGPSIPARLSAFPVILGLAGIVVAVRDRTVRIACGVALAAVVGLLSVL